jgi:two-component system, chemotaxis family, protein-glutamate methylesterase/glutaminase
VNPSPIRTLLVADVPGELRTVLEHDRDIEVIGHVASASAALKFLSTTQADIVVLSLKLADGSGQRAIEQIMDQAPTPILVLSSQLENRRSPSAVEALVAGALDALPTPPHWTVTTGTELREQVRRLSKVWVIRHLRGGRAESTVPEASRRHQRPVVAIAASTGGPKALAGILAEFGGLAAPVLVVQHLHPEFMGGLLDWMARESALPVEIARHHQLAAPGRVYLAPGGAHLRLGPRLQLELSAEPLSPHRPSADVLFTSVADEAGAAGVGVILTGMGDDGAQGLLAIRRQGGHTLAQDEQSCAVFGMPRAAQRVGAVTELLPVGELAAAVQKAVSTAARVRT